MLTGRPRAMPSTRSASRALRLPSSCSANPSTERSSMTRTRTSSGGETGRTDGGASARTTAPRIRAAGPREGSIYGAVSGLSVVARAVPVDEHNRFVADHPCIVARGQRGDVAGARVKLAAVRHLDAQHARRVILEVRRLAELGPRDRLDVYGPPPPGLEGQPPDRATADIDEIHAPLVENPLLVGAAESLVFRRDCRWHCMPPVNALGAVKGASGGHAGYPRLQYHCRPGCIHDAARGRRLRLTHYPAASRSASPPPRGGGRRKGDPPGAPTPPTSPGRSTCRCRPPRAADPLRQRRRGSSRQRRRLRAACWRRR